MKIQRMGRVSAVALIGALSMSMAACGSDDNSSSSSSSSSTPSSSSASEGSSTSAAGATDTAAASGSSAAPAGAYEPKCFEGDLKAEGSSAQGGAMEQVIKDYQNKCSGATIEYEPSGSGNGIKNFIAKQVNFAGTDSALKKKAGKDGKVEADEAKKTCGADAWNIPMVTGPIAVAYKLEGVDKLVLTPAVIAKIMDGKITKWNAPEIAKLNSGVTLPAKDIKVFFRSDDSGTTENFTKYLAGAAATDWTYEPAKKWPGKGEGKDKSSGVATAVKAQEGGVTYVEWAYAKDNGLGIAQIDNGGGAVELTGESVGKAVEAAKQDGEGNDLRLKLDYTTKEAGAYPILLVTYEVVCSKYSDAETGAKVKDFLKFMASADEQKAMEAKGYAPLPASVQEKVNTALDAIA